MESFRNLDRDGVGIDPVGATFAVESERRHDGDDAFLEHEFERFRVHPLDLAGVKMIAAAENARWVGDDGVEISGAKVDGGETLHDLVRQPDGGFDAECESRGVGDTGAVGVGNGDAAAVGQLLDLFASAVDENGPDAERTQDRKIDEDVGEIWRGGDVTVDGDDERPLAEAGDVLKNFAEIGDVHGP